MATVTGLTAARMIEMEAATIIDGHVVGNDLILVTRAGTEINVGNVRGPTGNTGPQGPLDQATADARYVNLAGDTMTARLNINAPSGVSEAIRLTHSASPYISFYAGALRTGFIQGRNDIFIVSAEDNNPLCFYTSGREQMRINVDSLGPELLTMTGNPDALIYTRGYSSGTLFNYFGMSGIWGFRATSFTGDTLIQAAVGATRIQAVNDVFIHPGDAYSAAFHPGGNVYFGKYEGDDTDPGFWWRSGHNALRTCCNMSNVNSVYLNRQGAGNSVGEQYIRFGASNTTVGSISRTSGGVAYNVTSDYRSKTIKSTISNALDKVKLLKPVRAVYKNDQDKREVDTFIAHEVAEVVPEAVTGEKDAVATPNNSEALGIPIGDPVLQQLDVSRLVPLLVASVQELSAKVDALQARLDAA